GLHAAVSDLRAIAADSWAARRTGADIVAGLAAAIGTRSVHAPTAISPTVLMTALRGLSDLLTRCAAFVRDRVDQRLIRRTPSFSFRVFVFLSLVSFALWWLTFYGRVFLSENIEARTHGALGKEISVADPTWATELTAATRAPKKTVSKETNKSPGPKEAK